MKKYNKVKVIDEENEEEINEDQKEEQPQDDFFIKDQETNERRKLIRSEKLKMENERSKTLINFNKLFEAIGWNKEEKNHSFNEIREEKGSSSGEENEKLSEDELEIFSEDENFLETNNKNRRNYFDDSIIFQDIYSVKQTYKNLLKQVKGERIFLSKNIKNKLLFNLTINIGDFIVSEGLFFNYVNYELEGVFKKKNFTLYRRYSEFAVYRKLLRTNWPGVFIPFLPPKKTYGNLDDTFILMRRKFLQYFCNKICSSPHLASSYETKIFLEPKNENFLELPIEIYQKSIEDISTIYNEFFGFLNEKEMGKQEKMYVENFYMTLSKSKKNIDIALILATEAKNIQMQAQRNLVNFYEYNYNVEDSLYNMFNYDQEKKEKLCENTIEINNTENIAQIKHENFFTTCFDFLTSVSDCIQGMIECISSLYELNEKFMAKFKELKEKNEKLKAFVNRNFIAKFFFPTNLNQVQQLINDIEQLKMELNTYKALVNLVYKIIYFIEIPTFKKDQYNYYINFLNKINEEESHVQRKNKIIYNLFRSKCDKIMRIIYEEAK
jgi:sorting nexin-1/2